jgi:cytoskeleton protein RodZ
MAQRLRLRPDIVDALEAGDYRALGAPVFVRGYLRSYALTAGVDPVELQPVFESLGDAPKLGPSPVTTRRNPWIERYSLAGTYLVGTVLVMWMVWAAVNTGLVARFAEPALPLSDAPEESVAIVTQPGPPLLDQPASDGFEADKPNVVENEGSTPPADTEATRQGPVMASMVPSLDRGEARFSVRVDADSWLEIRDATGKRLQYDIQPVGEREYRGKPPFELRIGNAGQAQLLVDGRRVDLLPFSRREIARLRLVSDGNGLRAEAAQRTAEPTPSEPEPPQG